MKRGENMLRKNVDEQKVVLWNAQVLKFSEWEWEKV